MPRHLLLLVLRQAAAVALTVEAGRAAEALGAPELVVWSPFDGYDYPLQVDHAVLWARCVEAFQRVADACPALKVRRRHRLHSPPPPLLPTAATATTEAAAADATALSLGLRGVGESGAPHSRSPRAEAVAYTQPPPPRARAREHSPVPVPPLLFKLPLSLRRTPAALSMSISFVCPFLWVGRRRWGGGGGAKVSLEFKPTDENMRYFAVPSTGAAVLLAREVGRPNFGLTLDVGHCLAAGENPAQSCSLAATAGVLFGVRPHGTHFRPRPHVRSFLSHVSNLCVPIVGLSSPRLFVCLLLLRDALRSGFIGLCAAFIRFSLAAPLLTSRGLSLTYSHDSIS